MLPSHLRRTLAAAVLSIGTAAAFLAAGAPALADDVGATSGGPLIEAEPTPLIPVPILPSAPALPEEPEDSEDSEKPRRPEGSPGDYEVSEACPYEDCPQPEERTDDSESEANETDGGCFYRGSDYTRVYCNGEMIPLDEDGCFTHGGHVFCPDPPVPGDEPGELCFPVEGHVECPEPETSSPPDCPMTHVSEECLPGDEPDGEPGGEPEDEPGGASGDRPGAKPRPGGGLPVTGPGLALLAGVGGLFTAIGAGGLLLSRRRRDGDEEAAD